MNWFGSLAETVTTSIGELAFGEEEQTNNNNNNNSNNNSGNNNIQNNKDKEVLQQRHHKEKHGSSKKSHEKVEASTDKSSSKEKPTKAVNPKRGSMSTFFTNPALPSRGTSPARSKGSPPRDATQNPISKVDAESGSEMVGREKKTISFDHGVKEEDAAPVRKKGGLKKGGMKKKVGLSFNDGGVDGGGGGGGEGKLKGGLSFKEDVPPEGDDVKKEKKKGGIRFSKETLIPKHETKSTRAARARSSGRKSTFGLGFTSFMSGLYNTEDDQAPLSETSKHSTFSSEYSIGDESVVDDNQFELEEEDDYEEVDEDEAGKDEDMLNAEDEDDLLENVDEGQDEDEKGAEGHEHEDFGEDEDSDADADDDINILEDTKFSIKSAASKKRALRLLNKAIAAARGHLPQAKFVGPNFGGGAKWVGGCRGKDGRIFFAPRNADHVLCVDPSKSTVDIFGDSLSFKWDIKAIKSGKYSDIVLGPDGNNLFLIPASARFVIRMDIRTGRAHILGDDLGGADWKFGRGVLCDGKIYCAPGSSHKVLMIDPANETAELIGSDYGAATAKWGGAVVAPLNNPAAASIGFDGVDLIIVFPPMNASQVLVLDPVNMKTALVGDDLGTEQYKYDGACLGADGAVYCAPCSASQALRIEFCPKSTSKKSASVELAQLQSRANNGQKLSLQEMMKMKMLSSQLTSSSSMYGNRKSMFSAEQEEPVIAPSHQILPWRYNIELLKSHYLLAYSLEDELNSSNIGDSGLSKKNSMPKMPKSQQEEEDDDEEDEEEKERAAQKAAKLAKMLGVSNEKLQSTDRASVFHGETEWTPRVTTELIGPSRSGNYKYSDTVMSCDGRTAIGIPLNFTFFIAIDTSSPDHPVARIGPRLEAKPKRLRCGSAVMGLDGYMYCAPLRAKRVLRLDALALSDAMSTTPAVVQDKTKVLTWQSTALEMFIRHLIYKRVNEIPWYLDSLNDRETVVAVAALAHWKTWAAKRSRETSGRSACDSIVRSKDRRMKALLVRKPDIWCFGLTEVDSIRSGDLFDWLNKFHSSEDGLKFITNCGLETKEDVINRVARVPDLVFSVISITNRGPLLKMPMIKRSLVCPEALTGNWLVRCLSDPLLMEGAVEFLELVSADLDTGTDKAISEAKRRVVCERIAGLNNLLAPMLRLPAHLQERVASSQVMIGVLDEMFIERPVALFVVTMDFFCVVAMLTLVLKIGWHVQHPGALRYGEWGQILVVLALNSYYLAREANNAIAMHRLGLQIDSQDVVDFTTIGFVTLTMILCLSEDTRMNDLFQMVAAVASGLCWFKLLGFLAGFNLKFALYYKSLIHITLALRSFVTILFLVMGMFASMFYLVINKRQWDRTEPREFDDGEIDDAFRTVGESFITLFRMMLGDFDREWFIQRTYSVNFFSTCLFIGYMIIVFIVMLNVLIAVVCDNYDYAMSKSRELFLRTRLALVAGLELQGYTTKRPKARDQVIESSDIGTRQSIFQRGRAATMRQSLVNGPATPAVIPLSVRLTGLSFLDRIDKYLKLTLWHRAMRKLVQLRYMFDDSGGDEDWNGRVKHLEREVTNIVNRRVTAAEERMIRAFEQHLERREAMYAAENHAKQAAAPGPPQQPAAPSDHAPPPGQSQSSSRSVQLAPTATPNSERTRPLSVQTSTPKKGVQMAQEPSSAKKGVQMAQGPSSAKKGVQMAQEPSRSPKKKGVQMVPES